MSFYFVASIDQRPNLNVCKHSCDVRDFCRKVAVCQLGSKRQNTFWCYTLLRQLKKSFGQKPLIPKLLYQETPHSWREMHFQHLRTLIQGQHLHQTLKKL